MRAVLSLENPVYGSVIVTSHRHVNAVKKLNSYWIAKSLFLKVKSDPRVLEDPEYQEKTLKFLEHNSSLAEQPFWQKLSLEKKLKATKYLTIQEVESRTIYIDSKPDRAEVYIILSGGADVFYGRKKESCAIGDVFGSKELFSNLVDQFDEDNEESEKIDDLSKAKVVGKAVKVIIDKPSTFLRFSIKDYYNNVLNEVETSDEEKERIEMEKIADMPYHLLTEEDFHIISLYKCAKTVLTPSMFSFLDSFKLIPRNSKMTCMRNYKTGNLGSEIILSKIEESYVYIVIKGSIRIEIISANKKKNSTSNVIVCKRKGSTNMNIKRTSMPLVLLDGGSVLHLSDNLFQYGNENKESLPSREVYESKPTTPSNNKSNNINIKTSKSTTSLKESVRKESDILSLSSTQINLKSKTKIISPKNKQKESIKYNLKLIFDKPTHYLAIPFSVILGYLMDEKLMIKDFSKVIRKQLTLSVESIKSRIEDLIPWINGSIDFDIMKNKGKKKNALDFHEENFTSQDIDNRLTGALDSFTKLNEKQVKNDFQQSRPISRDGDDKSIGTIETTFDYDSKMPFITQDILYDDLPLNYSDDLESVDKSYHNKS